MSTPPITAAAPAPIPIGGALPMIPGTPFDPGATTYTLFAGLHLEPYEHTGWVDETMSWKTTCYIGNWSTLGKAVFKGPGALGFLSGLTVNSLARFDVGQAKHMVMCTDAGKVAAEGILMRLSEDEFLLTSAPGVMWTGFHFDRLRPEATMTVVTADRFILQLQGPAAVHVLETAAGESVRDIGFMRFRKLRIGDIEFDALRQGMSGEIGYEFHGPIEQAEALYEAILQAGRPFGIRRLGGRSKMVNHAEACFPTPSVDFIPAFRSAPEFVTRFPGRFEPVTAGSFEPERVEDLFRSPVELGWKKNIRFDHDFIGRAALEAVVDHPRREMRTLVWNTEDVIDVYASMFRDAAPFTPMELPRNLLGCMWADKVLRDGRLIGVSTSRTFSLHARTMISLCPIDVSCAEPGTEAVLIWGAPGGPQKEIRVTVAPAPFKADNRRADLSVLADAPVAPKITA
jgi:glycine cleavage system aminomethyltransferase T